MKKELLFAILVGLVAACSNGSKEAKPIPLKFDSISMKRAACYGQCPIYTVEVFGNGQVKYTGEQFVKVKGVRQSSVPPADIELLVAALHHVKFQQIKEKYQFEEDGCISMPTDFPSLSISVTKAGNTKSVAFYTGCHGPTVPAEDLNWLANTIDTIAQTDHLISQWSDVNHDNRRHPARSRRSRIIQIGWMNTE